jgi:L-2-hydroxyglutarate oxidase LhgO
LGKLVVATRPAELPALRAIHERAVANQVPGISMLDGARAREHEPWVRAIAAVASPSSAVTDFRAVARALAEDVRSLGGQVRLRTPVVSLRAVSGGVQVRSAHPSDVGAADVFGRAVACAGLGTDRIGGGRSLDKSLRIVPFRGAYFRLSDRLAERIRGLVYPVPDPRYPFLGVHFTRGWDDQVLVGPTAVLALAPEGYRRRDVDPRQLADLLAFPGFWRMAGAHWRTGAREVLMSMSRQLVARQARRYLPELRASDLLEHPAGVRAQALGRDGTLVDDFVLDVDGARSVVRNAPSPAATSSLAIAEYVADRLERS